MLQTYSSGPSKDDALHCGPSLGNTEFCFTTFTNECSDGITQCASFVLTQDQVNYPNLLLGDFLPRIRVIDIEENVFTFEVED
ncbi:hypothetical protein [Aquimarina agarilytica]|uniref:hypothetical protein n=1 Tax=Aquimarina agarilytica TaxID=1087449 RepID=UPI000289EEA3|nr:hypothetical protein [Aquimarina agarilytica]